ncbi:hypothetical protein DL764_002274 [Monosporascus ibericus]|uniref:Cytochrome P450 n=1 Tax=Monosporascus ibericus TaxID=155417 RepID=A0A4V1XBY0_9PEZI|nr:hypothetical protein DL764_002274 [Monosporascus ibericus]
MWSALAGSAFPWEVQLTLLTVSPLILALLISLAIPRRLRGIPYNGGITMWFLGDIPSMVSHIRRKPEMYTWLSAQNVKLGSPIVQVSVRPFAAPWVVVADFREAQDVLTRRTKTFDRATFIKNVFGTLIPHGMITMKSDDPRLHTNKMLVRGFMAPTTLNEAIAPQLYKKTLQVMELWRVKAKLARGHPFEMTEDMANAAFDGIAGAVFSLDDVESIILAQIRLLSPLGSVPVPENDDAAAVHFPKAPMPPIADAIITLTDSIAVAFRSPLSGWHHWLLSQTPRMRKAYAIKEHMITQHLESAAKRLLESPGNITCLLDDLLQNELVAAAKEKRAPDYKSRAVYDELYEMVIGGYETTSATVLWGLKHLSNNQEAQSLLRTELQRALLPQAGHRFPTVEEIIALRVPYLDAVLEEIFRMALSASAHVRTATEDTTLLGHFIAKGTNVFLAINGPGFTSPPFPIREELRSRTSQGAKDEVRDWDFGTLGEFRPERWLVRDELGNETVDLSAAPQMLFSLGPRSCFGRRLGVLSIKITIVCVVWAFDLERVPDELNSFEGVEVLSRTPIQGFLKLRERSFPSAPA